MDNSADPGVGIPAPSGLTDFAAAMIENWRLLVGSMGLAVALVAGYILTSHQKFEASITLSTISTARSLPLSGAATLASSFLNIGGTGGLQPSPALIVRLASLPSVALSVATRRLPGDSITVIQRIQGVPPEKLSNRTIIRSMAKLISASFDRETGLVTLRVVHRDSALARLVAESAVDEISRVFRHASRAQASELKEAEQLRVDSAERQLRNAERDLVEFLAANRSISPYSNLQAQLRNLQRSVDLAQAIYLQVRSEWETAVGKELEETPAVVVLDPLPARLPALPSGGVGLIVFAVVASIAGASALIAVREWSRSPLESDRAAQERLRRALRSLPVVGTWAARLFAKW